MSFASRVQLLATRVGAEFKSVRTEIAAKADASHAHGVTDLTAGGTKSSTTFLRGDNTWAEPAAGAGPAGPAGTKWHTGATVPEGLPEGASAGDYFLHAPTGDIYELEAAAPTSVEIVNTYMFATENANDIVAPQDCTVLFFVTQWSTNDSIPVVGGTQATFVSDAGMDQASLRIFKMDVAAGTHSVTVTGSPGHGTAYRQLGVAVLDTHAALTADVTVRTGVSQDTITQQVSSDAVGLAFAITLNEAPTITGTSFETLFSRTYGITVGAHFGRVPAAWGGGSVTLTTGGGNQQYRRFAFIVAEAV